MQKGITDRKSKWQIEKINKAMQTKQINRTDREDKRW